jgi:hypothetical protein
MPLIRSGWLAILNLNADRSSELGCATTTNKSKEKLVLVQQISHFSNFQEGIVFLQGDHHFESVQFCPPWKCVDTYWLIATSTSNAGLLYQQPRNVISVGTA